MGASANITSEQEANLSADQKKRLQEYRASQQPAPQALAPMGAKGKGIVKGAPGSGIAPTPIGTPNPVPTGRTISDPRNAPDFIRPVDLNPSEAEKARDAQRARFDSEDARQSARERQSEQSDAARRSRRRNSILTSPLGTIGDLASAISKTLLGQ